MHRAALLRTLDEYALLSQERFGRFADEKARLKKMRAFVMANANCFGRENTQGHLTASAFILSSDLQSVLLTFHAKLKRWLQLGGHADGHPLLHEVAMREAQEESGMQDFAFFHGSLVPFDLDIHPIPAHKDVAAHDHYDLRYLLVARCEQPIEISHESLDLKWIPLNAVSNYTQELSVIRQVDKVVSLIK